MIKKTIIYSLLGITLAVGDVAVASIPIAYPQRGQSPEQQRRDESECNTFAREQQQRQPTQENSAAENVLGGALGGGAVGAVGGAIAGDAGTGAAIGAGVGALIGTRNTRQTRSQQNNESQDIFNRAFSACMETRGYLVK